MDKDTKKRLTQLELNTIIEKLFNNEAIDENFFEGKYVTEAQIYYVAARVSKNYSNYLNILNKMIDNSRISEDIRDALKSKFERESGKTERRVIKDREFDEILNNITENGIYPRVFYFENKIVKVSQIKRAIEKLGKDSNNEGILFEILSSARSNLDIKKMLDKIYTEYDIYRQLEEQWDEQSELIGEYKAIKEMIQRLKKYDYSARDKRYVEEENLEINQEAEVEPEKSEQEDKETKQNKQEEITNPFLKNLDEMDLKFIEVIQGVVNNGFASIESIMNLFKVDKKEADSLINKMIDLEIISSKIIGRFAFASKSSKRAVLITQEQLDELKKLIETKSEEIINTTSEENIQDTMEILSGGVKEEGQEGELKEQAELGTEKNKVEIQQVKTRSEEPRKSEQGKIDNPFLNINLDEMDSRFIETIQFVVNNGSASIDIIMKKLNMEFEEAKSRIDKMERLGIVSSADKHILNIFCDDEKDKLRYVRITQEQLDELKNLIEKKSEEKLNVQSEENINSPILSRFKEILEEPMSEGQQTIEEESTQRVNPMDIFKLEDEETIAETEQRQNTTQNPEQIKGESKEPAESVINEPEVELEPQVKTRSEEPTVIEESVSTNEQPNVINEETTTIPKVEEEESLEGEHKYSKLVEDIVKDRKSSEIEKVSKILEQVDDLDQENYQAEIKKVMETFNTEEGLRIGLINLGALMDEETKKEIEERIKSLSTNQQGKKTEDTKTENSDGEHTKSDKSVFSYEIDSICELSSLDQIKEELSKHPELIQNPNSTDYKILIEKLNAILKKQVNEYGVKTVDTLIEHANNREQLIDEIIQIMVENIIKGANIKNLEFKKEK